MVNVRFLVLLSSDPALASMGFQLTERIRRTFKDAWIGLLIPDTLQWLPPGFNSWDELFIFRKNPGERLSEIREKLPDYLIDISGNFRLGFFKNRLRVTDFSLKYKSYKAIKNQPDLQRQLELFHEATGLLLSPFDLSEPVCVGWIPDGRDEAIKEYLPDSFHKGFIWLDLSGMVDQLSDIEQLTGFLSILDYPTVLSGSSSVSEIGDELSRKVGCTVFNLAGYADQEKINLLVPGADLVIGKVGKLKLLAFISARLFMDVDEIFSSGDTWIIQPSHIRERLIRKK